MSSHEQPEDVIDLAAAQERIPGGTEALNRMARLLLGECPKLMNDIREGLAEKDAKRLQRGAHTLKGSADVFAASRVVAVAKQLEAMGREAEFQGAEAHLAELEHEVARLEEALRAV